MTKTALSAALLCALTGAASAQPFAYPAPSHPIAGAPQTSTVNFANGSRMVTTSGSGLLNGNPAVYSRTTQIAPNGQVTSTNGINTTWTRNGNSTTSLYANPSSPYGLKTIVSTPNSITLNANDGSRNVTTFQRGLLNGNPTSRMTTQQISASGRITSSTAMDITTTKTGSTTTFYGK